MGTLAWVAASAALVILGLNARSLPLVHHFRLFLGLVCWMALSQLFARRQRACTHHAVSSAAARHSARKVTKHYVWYVMLVAHSVE